MADIGWNEAPGRFTDGAGRFVSDARVRAVVDQIADAASARMAAVSERMLSGEISLGSWQVEMARVLKDAHLAAATLAHGGSEAMTFSHYGSAGHAIRDQYAYLRQFAADVASGRQPLTRAIVSRAEMYGQAARVTFESERARAQADRGVAAERNVLGPAEHCAECLALSARGWVPIGTLPPIGSRTCRANDRCSLSYRQEPAEAAA